MRKINILLGEFLKYRGLCTVSTDEIITARMYFAFQLGPGWPDGIF
jgi:hypothetical protein